MLAVGHPPGAETLARAVILRTIPNRPIYLDGQGFDMSPYTQSEVRYSSEGFLSIRGGVIGPDDQPLEGIRLWAWTGSADNSRTAKTGQDGSFALLVQGGRRERPGHRRPASVPPARPASHRVVRPTDRPAPGGLPPRADRSRSDIGTGMRRNRPISTGRTPAVRPWPAGPAGPHLRTDLLPP